MFSPTDEPPGYSSAIYLPVALLLTAGTHGLAAGTWWPLKQNQMTRCSTSAILGFNEYVQSLIDKDGGASIPPGSKDSMSPDHAGEHSGGYPISSTVPTALDLFLSSHI
ncbi:hypothetical protein AcW1_010041 [Taiwanofungus camphoratus]|nr:hypothetical protein AcW1_010041 [Antrodia cinnamomea]